MFVADLLEAERQVVAIFPGRFHPFHKGHAYMYQQLVSRYGRDRSFIATSNKVELPKSPFSFSDKAQMMRVAGIPADKIIETRNPYQAQEIVGNFDPASTVLIFAVSQKDMDEDPRFSFKPKKDGSPSYFQRLPDDLKNAKTLDQHGYITTLPTLDFTVLGEPMRSATELRAKYTSADDDTRKAIIKDLYGSYSEEIKSIMDNKLNESKDDWRTQLREAAGRIVKGVNTTPDVGVNQISIEAAKFGNKVDKDGRPPTLSTKVKGKSTNVAFNLGLTESLYKLNRDDPMNSEVLITGMGRYNIKTLHKNLAEKLKDLSERMASMDPDQAQQARYLLTKSPLIPMMDALQQAYDDLKEIKRKGGVRSRGIDL